MSIIVDANRAGDFSPPHAAHAPEITRRIAQKRMYIVVGGKLLRELSETKIRSLVVEWLRSGCAIRIDDSQVDAEEERFRASDLISDDPHVVALANLSGCRLLYSNDEKLILDFKDTSILTPKGKVIKSTTRREIASALFERYGRK